VKARYTSVCSKCSKMVAVGEEIDRTGFTWVHRACLYGPPKAQPKAESEAAPTDDAEVEKLRAEVARWRRLNSEKLREIERLQRDVGKWRGLAWDSLGSTSSTPSGSTVIGEDRLGKVLSLAMRAGTEGEALAALDRARAIHERMSA
jgi:hypothetical protein